MERSNVPPSRPEFPKLYAAAHWCVVKGIKVCREIFVFRQKAIESWFPDDLCVHVVLILLKILNTGCLSKNLKGKRSICIKLFVLWT